MILVDTSVIIDYLRAPSPDLLAVIQSSDTAICGVTRAEILTGARHSQQRQRLILLLNSMTQITIDDLMWDQVGDLLASLRRAGLTVPFPDAILATLAISMDIRLWSRDQHFPMMQQILPALKLYQEMPEGE